MLPKTHFIQKSKLHITRPSDGRTWGSYEWSTA